MPVEPVESALYDQAPTFAAFDPTTVPPVSTEEQAPQQDPERVDVPAFDPKVQQEFEGLLYLGALTSGFSWLGHHFVIRTLRTGEMIEIALAVKKYAGTEGELKAYQAGVVAACVVSVDHRDMPVPILSAGSPFLARFEYVLNNWFPPLLDVIYEKYLLLEKKSRQVIEAMGNHSG